MSKIVLGTLSLMTIAEKSLNARVIRDLEGREAFKDADTDHNERIYHGDVFEAIINEFADMEGTPMYPEAEVMEQLAELAERVDADYVLIMI
jgi:hypothetical protein